MTCLLGGFYSTGSKEERGTKRSSAELTVSFQSSKRRLPYVCNFRVVQAWRVALREIEDSLCYDGVGFPGAVNDEELWSALVGVLASPGGPTFAQDMLEKDVDGVQRELLMADLDFTVMGEALLRRLCHAGE
jgi:hypothetical protein